jgi:hypothetical protein
MNPGFFWFLVRMTRRIVKPYQVCQESPPVSPAVYLVHHQDLRGPFLSMLWFNDRLHPWGLSVFFDRRECFRQYYNFTFSKRLGVAKVFAAIPAYLLSRGVSAIMPIIGAIPVYRGKQAIVQTFRQSVTVLEQGESILIAPDINYTEKKMAMGDMHRGFLFLDRFYARETGRHVPFIPLHVSKHAHCIFVGRPILFSAGTPFSDQQAAVHNKIKEEFQRLENLSMPGEDRASSD